jgi:hypothetical protein
LTDSYAFATVSVLRHRDGFRLSAGRGRKEQK